VRDIQLDEERERQWEEAKKWRKKPELEYLMLGHL
jgi:hypothetical protein